MQAGLRKASTVVGNTPLLHKTGLLRSRPTACGPRGLILSKLIKVSLSPYFLRIELAFPLSYTLLKQANMPSPKRYTSLENRRSRASRKLTTGQVTHTSSHVKLLPMLGILSPNIGQGGMDAYACRKDTLVIKHHRWR